MRYYYGGVWRNTENVPEIRAYSELFVRSKNNKRLGIEIDPELRCKPHYTRTVRDAPQTGRYFISYAIAFANSRPKTTR